MPQVNFIPLGLISKSVSTALDLGTNQAPVFRNETPCGYSVNGLESRKLLQN